MKGLLRKHSGRNIEHVTSVIMEFNYRRLFRGADLLRGLGGKRGFTALYSKTGGHPRRDREGSQGADTKSGGRDQQGADAGAPKAGYDHEPAAHETDKRTGTTTTTGRHERHDETNDRPGQGGKAKERRAMDIGNVHP